MALLKNFRSNEVTIEIYDDGIRWYIHKYPCDVCVDYFSFRQGITISIKDFYLKNKNEMNEYILEGIYLRNK